MIAVPEDTPVTMPVGPTVATDAVALLHTPPKVSSFNVVDAPAQILLTPVIAAGNGLIVTIAIALHPDKLAV